jgi:hypothetical protein
MCNFNKKNSNTEPFPSQGVIVTHAGDEG